MSSLKASELVTVVIVSLFGVYSGMKFFQPIVINQLKTDGNLRTDIKIPQYDEEGNSLTAEETDKYLDRIQKS